MKLYRIRNWGSRYENNRTRELRKLDWVPIPNKQDGDGYTQIMDIKNGAAIYGAWVALVQIASRCDPRGTLLRDSGKPHDPASLARMARMPVALMGEMLLVCSGEDVNWLETTETPGVASSCGNPAPSCGEPTNGAAPSCAEPTPFAAPGCLEGKGMEEKEEKGTEVGENAADAAPALTDEQWLESLKADPTYQGIDVAVQYGKMVNWCRENKKQTTRRRFVNWLNRCDKPMTAGAGQAPLPVWLQIKNLEDRILQHPANRASSFHDINATAEQKAELKTLRSKLNELKGNTNEQ